jgi:hypothetical protein
MHHALEEGRDVFQHFPFVLADLAEQRAATAWARTGRFVNDDLARQMIRQRFAAGLFTPPLGAGCRLGRGSCVLPSLAFGLALLEIAYQKLQLLNFGVELFRGAAEPRASQNGELRLQLLDMQRLGVNLRVARRDLAPHLDLQGRRKSAQLTGIMW